jgi:putative ABC transport system ATP-binding protein
MTNTPDATPIIDVRGASKIFYTEEVETHALSGIDISIRKGEYVAIIGASGSGKTTLLAILGLLERPSAGVYRLDGTSVEDMTDTSLARMRNEHIGFIFQTFNLIGDISVFANVELPLLYRGLSRDERRERVHATLERVGMSHRARHMPGQLSGGQQQRVAVARALVGNPSILLADEPTGNLDSTNGEMVMQLISELHAAGSTICMVTHDLRFALHASRRVQMADGRLAGESS